MLPDDSRWRDLFSGKNAAISIALSFGVVIHAVNILMATTILPSVVADIGGLNLYARNTTLFVAASIIGSVLSARLLAVYGARIAYLISVVAFSPAAWPVHWLPGWKLCCWGAPFRASAAVLCSHCLMP